MALYSLLLILSCLLQVQAFYSKEDLCSMEKEEGKCTQGEKVERWYYNNGVCETFLYTGCGGQANSFATKEECYGTCGDICLKPAVKGRGKLNQTRYYYNGVIGDCVEFTYKGFGGNKNNFPDYTYCRKVCKNECTLEPEVGVCKARFARVFYNIETGACEEFYYGGCGGNNNNFRTMLECEKKCGKRWATNY